MTIEERATKALQEAEQKLAELSGKASTERRYDLAASLVALAQQLATSSERFRTNPAPARSDVPADEAEDAPQTRFERQGDWLVKTAASRKGGEYEHKCPRDVVRAVATTISRLGATNKQFSSDKLMPLQDPTTGNEAPSYQIYLSLLWLRRLGLVEKHGRSRYSLKSSDIVSSIENAWQSLPAR